MAFPAICDTDVPVIHPTGDVHYDMMEDFQKKKNLTVQNKSPGKGN